MPNYPKWLETAVMYQVYPQSFKDSNGDGIGDLPGIIAKLDYIRSTGANVVWLNPIFVSPFGDAGYDVSDYKKVAPRYGTNADARRLFREAHKRGLRVVLDLVAGHTSIHHPWFKASCDPKPNPYSDYYIWTDRNWRRPPDGEWIRGFADREGIYRTNFFWFQPALNYGYAKPNPAHPWELPPDAPACRAVREELRSIMKFWLDAGCDGFRVDMASSLIKGDTTGRALRALWQDYRGWMEREYPEAVLVAEWGNPARAIWSGFHVDFLMHAGEPAYQRLLGGDCLLEGVKRTPPVFFQRAGGVSIEPFLENYLKHYRATRGKGFISLPTANHDFPRPSRGRAPCELRAIMAMLLTMPGVPIIYYGDEIGMRWLDDLISTEGAYHSRVGTRTPMQWNAKKNAGFSTASPGKLYLPVDGSRDAPNVAACEKDPASILHLVRTLIAMRREHGALGNCGAFRALVARKNAPFVYERSRAGQRFIIAINPQDRARACRLPVDGQLVPVLAEGMTVQGARLEAGPVSFGIFRWKPKARRSGKR
jgi:glycosidase